VTGPDIIFFWVARMIMAGYEFTGKMPFRNVYFTGIVRDKLGRKMSKSLGNSPDPLDLIDRFGADGVRMGMMLAAPAGNDILFDEALCEQGRNFCNKIWNSYRLVKGWQVAEAEQSEPARLGIAWFGAELRRSAAEMAELFGKYRLSEALMEVYRLIRDEFSGWYLEMIKPAYGDPIDAKTYAATLGYFDQLLHLLHPFMPFITEELWQNLEKRAAGESIMVSPQQIDAPETGDAAVLEQVAVMKNVVTGVRAVRQQKNLAQRDLLTLEVVGNNPVSAYDSVICKMAGVSEVRVVAAKSEGTQAFLVGTAEFAVELGGLIDVEAEAAKAEAEIKRLEGFLAGIEKKLANERFMQHAPAAVVELERKKQSDARSKIEALRETLAVLKK
ncbi:MAG: class I tRNA ligase family protein, partial [Prevotellaceae bacterium]|nr:class I tRNA ligase family protein [Prevotellaceae bacterium]